MGEEVPPTDLSSPPSPSWQSYISTDLPRSAQESAHSAIQSARSIQQSSTSYFRTFQDFASRIGTWYTTYEEAFFRKVKDELVSLQEHPVLAGGAVAISSLMILRGPRRFLFRQTLGRLQSEEAQFVKAEKNVKELGVSVDLMKKESKKLLERATLAEKDMKRGHSDLMSAGVQIRSLGRSVYKAESQADDLVDLLREIPGREALKLRAEVASMASQIRKQRMAMNKSIIKISELGIPV